MVFELILFSNNLMRTHHLFRNKKIKAYIQKYIHIIYKQIYNQIQSSKSFFS